jgi:hypothetical protein
MGPRAAYAFFTKVQQGVERICDLQSRLPQANAPDMFFCGARGTQSRRARGV